MKALGFPVRDDVVVGVIEQIRHAGMFRAGHVKGWFEQRGVSPLISCAAADNLLRRMKQKSGRTSCTTQCGVEPRSVKGVTYDFYGGC